MRKAFLTAVFFAAATAQAAEPFVGKYHSGGVDWGSQLLLLDNQKFCYAISAGNMDMLTGGSWHKTAQDGDIITIQLTEQKLPISDVVIVANPKVDDSTLANAQKQTGSRRILFLTPPALGDALGSSNPLIAFGTSAKPSTPFKWAYPTTGGTPLYARIGIPENARYVFVGSSENNQLYRFNIGNSNHAKLNPNPQAGRQSLDISLRYNVKTQLLNDEKLRQDLPANVQQTAWRECEPQAKGAATSVQGKARTLLNAEAAEPLSNYYQQGKALGAWQKK